MLILFPHLKVVNWESALNYLFSSSKSKTHYCCQITLLALLILSIGNSKGLFREFQFPRPTNVHSYWSFTRSLTLASVDLIDLYSNRLMGVDLLLLEQSVWMWMLTCTCYVMYHNYRMTWMRACCTSRGLVSTTLHTGCPLVTSEPTSVV